MNNWDYEYIGPKKRRKVTPQMRALRERRQSGLKMAKPAETRQRVLFIINMMHNGMWKGGPSIISLSVEWKISISRVEQLAAEAKRNG